MSKRPSSTKKKVAKPAKPGLNIPLLVLRIGLGLVLLAVVVLAIGEVRTRSNYNASLAELQKYTQDDEQKELKRKDLSSVLSGSPSQSTSSTSKPGVVILHWGSVFKRYDITATFDTDKETGTLLSVSTTDMPK